MKRFAKVFFVSFLTVFFLLLFSSKGIGNFFQFFAMPFASSYFLFTFLNSFSTLLFASSAQYISLSTGNYNLGGQGQIYAGGLLAALLLTQSWQNPFVNILYFLACLLLVFLAGALITFISGILKYKKGIDELLSSFILSSAIIIFADYLCSNTFKDKSTNLLATEKIAEFFQFEQFGSGPLNTSIFASLILFILLLFFYKKTSLGKKFVLTGKAHEFAQFRGIDVKKIDYFSLCLSGALHSLCGFFLVTGTYYACYQGFYGGIGWNALTCALVAGANPLLILPSCLMFSYFFSCCDFASLTNSLSSGSSFILQAVVLVFASISEFRAKKGGR
ncbi:MAG: hypothetical protein K5839_00620 [Treponemataceae bacterium]|nr:hypothetical protein [Treponemataceae bacterium]